MALAFGSGLRARMRLVGDELEEQVGQAGADLLLVGQHVPDAFAFVVQIGAFSSPKRPTSGRITGLLPSWPRACTRSCRNAMTCAGFMSARGSGLAPLPFIMLIYE